MIWARMLSYITGTVDQELLLRNEYLAAENRVLRAQISGRLLLSDAEKATLAEIAHRLGRKALEEVAGTASSPWWNPEAKQHHKKNFHQIELMPAVANESSTIPIWVVVGIREPAAACHSSAVLEQIVVPRLRLQGRLLVQVSHRALRGQLAQLAASRSSDPRCP
jgi:hypothetical protein